MPIPNGSDSQRNLQLSSTSQPKAPAFDPFDGHRSDFDEPIKKLVDRIILFVRQSDMAALRRWRIAVVILAVVQAATLIYVFFRSPARYEIHKRHVNGVGDFNDVFDAETGKIVYPETSVTSVTYVPDQELPKELLAKITGDLHPEKTAYGTPVPGVFSGRLYNGTNWTISEVTIEIAAQMGAAKWIRGFKQAITLKPLSTGSVSIDAAESRPIDRHEFRVVAAKGRSE